MFEADVRTISGESVQDVTFECRTSICRASWTDRGEENRMIGGALKKIYGGSAATRQRNELLVFLKGGFLKERGINTQEQLIAHMKNKRARLLKAVQEGRAPMHYYLMTPKGRWPGVSAESTSVEIQANTKSQPSKPVEKQ
jgi:hypothetical protein